MLIGMSPLRGSRLTMDGVSGGAVVIVREDLKPPPRHGRYP